MQKLLGGIKIAVEEGFEELSEDVWRVGWIVFEVAGTASEADSSY
ncbi:hypothetical protein [Halovivax gelatinilyticus]|nr:hypothetical protein [Halovivax gelatinilyticus]